MDRTLQTSGADHPTTSRRVITSRCVGGSASIALRTLFRVSLESNRASGIPDQLRGGDAQVRGRGSWSPWKRAGSTTGVVAFSPSRDEKPPDRASCTARLLARFMTMLQIHVFSDDLASNRPLPRRTPNQAS